MAEPHVDIWSPTPAAEVRQVELGPYANLNHLIRCTRTGAALLVDPFDGPWWEETLAAAGIPLHAIALTHSHHDHVRGVPHLHAALPQATIHAHVAEAERGWNGPHTHTWTHAPGTTELLPVGELRFEVHATPGHTPGHVTLIGHGLVITGDCLFLGRCGRCDLEGGDPRAMWESLMRLRTRLSTIPEWEVLAGHRYEVLGGSSPRRLPVHEVMATNPALADQSFETFRRLPFLAFDDGLGQRM